MSRKEDLSSLPYQEIYWSGFPKPARRMIKEMLDDITSEIDAEPDISNRIKEEVIACIAQVSEQTTFWSAKQLGKAMLAQAEIVEYIGEKPDSVATHLSLIGNALLSPSKQL